jgi:hypothetical protein
MQDPAAFESLFNQWESTFVKSYPSASERTYRSDIFRQNVERMVAINANPGFTFWMQPSTYTDLTDEEFVRSHYGADYTPRRIQGVWAVGVSVVVSVVVSAGVSAGVSVHRLIWETYY